MQKKIKQFYYDKTLVNLCKGCDVHMFLLKKLYRKKGGQKLKIKWIFELNVWTVAY